MKTFYSILQVPLRPAGQEQLNIGLLLVGEREVLFSYSDRKLAVLKNLIPDTAFKLLKSYLLSLKTKIGEEVPAVKEKFSKIEFVHYLSDYNNNLLTFSKPTPIAIDAARESFQKLFTKFVYEEAEEMTPASVAEPRLIYGEVETRLFPKIKDKVNLRRKVTPNDFKSLITPVNVDFIGKNNAPVAGVTVDFSKSENAVSNSLAKFVSLIHALDRDDVSGGTYFVIGKEPQKETKQHVQWNDMRETGFVKFVDVRDVDGVAEYIDEHKVKPLFPEKN